MNMEVWKVLKEEISENNVLQISEYIALKATKYMIGWAGYPMVGLYKVLYRDILHRTEVDYVVSDAYDFVQTVALFLCNYMGHHLNDIECKDWRGKPISICRYCFRIMNSLLSDVRRTIKRDRLLRNLLDNEEPTVEFDTYQEKDWTLYDNIVSKMNLDEKLSESLEYFMSSRTSRELEEYMGITHCTVYRRKRKLQQRYKMAVKELGLEE